MCDLPSKGGRSWLGCTLTKNGAAVALAHGWCGMGSSGCDWRGVTALCSLCCRRMKNVGQADFISALAGSPSRVFIAAGACRIAGRNNLRRYAPLLWRGVGVRSDVLLLDI